MLTTSSQTLHTHYTRDMAIGSGKIEKIEN